MSPATTEHPPTRAAAVAMLADWMGARFYRTFRPADGDPMPFDARLAQRERSVGVTVGALWQEEPDPAGELNRLAFASELAADLEDPEPGFVLWVPPHAPLPEEEPQRSRLRLALSSGMRGLAPGEAREVRLTARMKLAKIEADGQYVSVTGPLSREWTTISDGVNGAFHLDARPVHRLPREQAELDIIIARIRDRAVLLREQEVSDVDVHDYWRVSRLPDGGPDGAIVVATRPDVDVADGAMVRRALRREVARAVEQRSAGDADLSVLALVGVLGHIEDELATASLRGMNPALYNALDLIVLIADGQVRQVLQPRQLPWEQPR